jgi:ribosomal protein S18 acetylase RimI-like enzyme
MTLTAHDATRADYAEFARLFPELGVPDPTPTEDEYDARVRPHAFFVREGARVIAYANWLALGPVARVLHVIVAPEARGRGVGGAVMKELTVRAKAAGCSEWMLYVEPHNAHAIRLYERFGMRAAGRMHAMKIAWRDVARVPIEAGLASFVVEPRDDARVEEAASLFPGQIAAHRAGGGRVFLGVTRGEAIAGFASFDPSFPGAMPFFAPTVGVARALFEAMRAHAKPEHAYVRFSATSDAVVAATKAAGAETVLEALHMEGNSITARR